MDSPPTSKAKRPAGRLTRRRLLALALLGSPLLALGDAGLVEPKWVKLRRLRLGQGPPTLRVVHFTDVHHKGDRAYLRAAVASINALAPDVACFTGDLIEERQYMAEAVELLAGIQAPLFAVPGNHDYWSKASFEGIARCCAARGGAWLLNQQRVIRDGRWTITGAATLQPHHPLPPPNPATRNLLLMHYPAWAQKLAPARYDLMLAGHSHGGQVRVPWLGPITVPFDVEPYDLGLYQTPAGPLYVNPGLGWFPVPLRFNCRPELTLIELS